MSNSETAPDYQVTVAPQPTQEELTAILLAYQQAWPTETELEADSATFERWKFSNRWWADGRTHRAPASGWR